jgi:hypothetical protein
MVTPLVLREVKNSRDSEETPAAMEQVFAVLGMGHGSQGLFSKLFGSSHPSRFFSFEIVSFSGIIHFYIVAPEGELSYLESQLTTQYPKVMLSQGTDGLGKIFAAPHMTTQLVFTEPFYLPIKTYADIKDIDLLSGPLGQLAKLPEGQSAGVQLWVEPAGNSWKRAAAGVVARGIPDPTSTQGRTKAHPQARVIERKLNQVGFKVGIRLVVSGGSPVEEERLLRDLAGSYGVFAAGDGNGLTMSNPHNWNKKKLEEAIYFRKGDLIPRFQVFGSSELATLWHPPGLALSSIKNISWGTKLIGEAPENLPVSTKLPSEGGPVSPKSTSEGGPVSPKSTSEGGPVSTKLPSEGGPVSTVGEEVKKEINFFARTEFKNKIVTFGIKKEDRRKHMYVVGKTGTGKSTMIANMVINDMRNGEGVAVIDPHGDLTNALLDYIPSHRINDVAYLDPSDTEHPFHLNPLEVENVAQREIVASGIVSIFYKLYAHSWGPRLEYILRNTILTLLYVPQSTLLQVPELLTDERFRQRVLEKLPDQVLKNFWINEFGKMTPQLRSEATMPILNKVGQFLSSQTIRNIVGHPKSTINLEAMMNDGKIVLMNLSQGKLGEDNSALLGAMMITKIQLAAMGRVYQTEENRKDFYLYVDEFQNFATSSFVKILSEARKYRLNLTLANQYIGQIDEEVQNAIFGNAGSIVSFGVGATDARPLAREFGLKYKEEELVGLGNYQIVLKLSVDNHTSSPFSATTLPLSRSHNQGKEKVLRSSRERFTKKI